MNLSSSRSAIALIRGAGDTWLVAFGALVIAAGLAPLASVYVTRQVVDTLVPAVASHGDWTLVGPLVFWAVAAGVVIVASQALQGATGWVRLVLTERLRDHITARIHEQSARVDLAFYDSADFFDHLHRARDEASYRPGALVEAAGDVAQGVITLTGMAAMLVLFGWWLPVALVAGALPVLAVVARHALAEQRWRREVTADERRTWYYDEVLTSAPFAAELRLFGLGPRFRAAHEALRAKLLAARLALVRRRGISEALAGIGGLIVTAAAFGWMVSRAVAGALTLGQLAAFYQAFTLGLSTLRQLLSGLGRLYANSLFMENLFAFLALQPRIVEPVAPRQGLTNVARGMRFRDVTFRYAEGGRAVLDRFDLFVPAEKSVAIVGPNGSGKSTLVKLITRLYDPTEGAIEIDDADVRAFAVADVRRAVTVLFQEPARYAESVVENMRMGVTASVGQTFRSAGSGVGVTASGGQTFRSAGSARPDGLADDWAGAAIAAGADFAASLPNGYDTLLGKRFEHGTELSTGEWQRIALARAFLRPSPILVLDEPTSALDPWAESDWYRRFREAARGRTSIVITHRFTTAMQADVIHVMEGGRIVESGSHEELLSRGGRYATSWTEQVRGRVTRDDSPVVRREVFSAVIGVA